MVAGLQAFSQILPLWWRDQELADHLGMESPPLMKRTHFARRFCLIGFASLSVSTLAYADSTTVNGPDSKFQEVRARMSGFLSAQANVQETEIFPGVAVQR